MPASKVLHLLYRKEITYTLQPHLLYIQNAKDLEEKKRKKEKKSKVDYRPVNVQCPNSTQDNAILMMVLEAVM